MLDLDTAKMHNSRPERKDLGDVRGDEFTEFESISHVLRGAGPSTKSGEGCKASCRRRLADIRKEVKHG